MPNPKQPEVPEEAEARGIGAQWAIKQALADALRRAAENLEAKDLGNGERGYNAHIEWPRLFTFKAEEGPAALRGVAEEICKPIDATRKQAQEEERERVRELLEGVEEFYGLALGLIRDLLKDAERIYEPGFEDPPQIHAAKNLGDHEETLRLVRAALDSEVERG